MKITKVRKELTYYVTTDDPDWPEYRTDETGEIWENLMGESWESVYDDEKLKMMFRDYLNSNGFIDSANGVA